MPALLLPQGTLNRLRGTVSFLESPDLNIIPDFLGPEGINMVPEGDLVDTLPSMTGTVPSPNPYQMYTVEIELLKTQGFADRFKKRIEFNSIVGAITVRADASTLSNYNILNCSIYAANPGRLNGTSVAFMIGLRGYYQVNSSLYDG